jgi:hypothetical protein
MLAERNLDEGGKSLNLLVHEDERVYSRPV